MLTSMQRLRTSHLSFYDSDVKILKAHLYVFDNTAVEINNLNTRQSFNIYDMSQTNNVTPMFKCNLIQNKTIRYISIKQ